MFTQEEYQIIHSLVRKESEESSYLLHCSVYEVDRKRMQRVSEEKIEYQYKLDRLIMKLGKEIK